MKQEQIRKIFDGSRPNFPDYLNRFGQFGEEFATRTWREATKEWLKQESK